MSNATKITLSNKLLVPDDLVKESDLLDWYYEWTETTYEPVVDMFDEVVMDERDNPLTRKVVTTHSLKSYRQTFNSKEEPCFEFPRGDLRKLQKFLKLGYRDLRPVAPLGHSLRMLENTLQDKRWPDQKRCIGEFLSRGSGIIEGDTGSGKTIIGIGCICRLQMKTLIMSPQSDGSTQWINELRKHTNINQIEAQYGIQIIGEYKSNKGIAYPITVSTVQAFVPKKSRAWLLKHRNDFGLVLVDEVHAFGSNVYSKVVQAINALTFLGLTATVERKDNRHHLLYDIVGPVVARGKARQMPPTVYFIATDVEAPAWIYRKNFPRHFQWAAALKHIEKDDGRYELIRKYLIQDVDDGRCIACISSQRRSIVYKLYQMLRQDGYDVEYVDGKTPKRMRQIIYDKVKARKVQILFAGKVLNQLVDLPTIDCLHFITPSSSHTTTKQTYGRARRWLEGKRNPIIRDYVDTGGQFDGAYKNRLLLCQQSGWDVKRIETERGNSGLSIWKKRDV